MPKQRETKEASDDYSPSQKEGGPSWRRHGIEHGVSWKQKDWGNQRAWEEWAKNNADAIQNAGAQNHPYPYHIYVYDNTAFRGRPSQYLYHRPAAQSTWSSGPTTWAS